jgi:hypothetical protein
MEKVDQNRRVPILELGVDANSSSNSNATPSNSDATPSSSNATPSTRSDGDILVLRKVYTTPTLHSWKCLSQSHRH